MKAQLNKAGIFSGIIYRIMLIFLAIYPFALTAANVWPLTEDGFGRISDCVLIWIFVLALLFFHITIFKSVPSKTTIQQDRWIVISLFLGAFLLRLIVATLLQVEPFSDFGSCYKYAINKPRNYNADYLANFPYLGAYALTLKLLFHFVTASVQNAQILDGLVTSCIPVFLYFAIKKMWNRSDIAVAAGAFYALHPGMIIYTAVTSCEHFSQFFLALFLLFLACFYRENQNKRRWIYAALSGIALGGVCIYKELYIILVPALLMTFFCYELLPALIDQFHNKRFDRKYLFALCARTLVIVLVGTAVYQFGVAVVQKAIVGETRSRNTSPAYTLAATVYGGLSPVGRGKYSAEIKDYMLSLDNSGLTDQEKTALVWNKLLEEYRSDQEQLMPILQEKFYEDWCREETYYYWTYHGSGNVIQGTRPGKLIFALFPSLFWTMASAVICIGLIANVFRFNSESENFKFFVVGIVFLFTLALILMEAQARYKSNFMPAFSILYAWGLSSACSGTNIAVRRISKEFYALKETIREMRK